MLVQFRVRCKRFLILKMSYVCSSVYLNQAARPELLHFLKESIL